MDAGRLLILLVFIGASLTVLVFQGGNLISTSSHDLSSQVAQQDQATDQPAVVEVNPDQAPEQTPAKDPVPGTIDDTSQQQQSQDLSSDLTGIGGDQTASFDDKAMGGDQPVDVVQVPDQSFPTADGTDKAVLPDDKTPACPMGGDVPVAKDDVKVVTLPDCSDGVCDEKVETTVEGSLEFIDEQYIVVRAHNPKNPENRPYVTVHLGGYPMATARAGAEGLVQFDYHMLAQIYDDAPNGYDGRSYALEVTVTDPDTREAFTVFETDEFLFPAYGLEDGELALTRWSWRRTSRRSGTLSLWLTSSKPGRSIYRIVGGSFQRHSRFHRRGLFQRSWEGQAVAHNQGSDVFFVELEDFPASSRDLPELALADDEWQPVANVTVQRSRRPRRRYPRPFSPLGLMARAGTFSRDYSEGEIKMK